MSQADTPITNSRVLGPSDSPDPIGLHRAPVGQSVLNIEAPPEPFSQLMPGEEIQDGDIVKVIGVNNPWRAAHDGEFGTKVPEYDKAVARLKVPDDYRYVRNHEPIEPRDLYLTDQTNRWESVQSDWLGKTGAEVFKTWPAACFVARPEFEPCVARDLDMPNQHRELAPGETVRRGDKMIFDGLDGWQSVSELLRGSTVSQSTESTAYVRYCRPIHPSANTWYVDPSGAADNLGGFEDPFPDLETACAKIEKAANAIKQAPYGVIRSKAGAPLLAYDLPEPPPPPERQLRRQFTRTLPVPANCKVRRPGELIQVRDQIEIDGRWESAAALVGLPVDKNHVVRRKKNTGPGVRFGAGHQPCPKKDPVATKPMQALPVFEEQSIAWIAQQMQLSPSDVCNQLEAIIPDGFRRLDHTEEMREGDALACFAKFSGNYSFQDVPTKLLGTKVQDYFVVRARLMGATDDVHQRIELLERRIEDILAELQDLKEALR